MLVLIFFFICRMGGPIQCIKWDPMGERLAVIFRRSDVVALFCTRESEIGGTISVSPLGLVRSAGDSPACIDFCKSFRDGALLTVVRND